MPNATARVNLTDGDSANGEQSNNLPLLKKKKKKKKKEKKEGADPQNPPFF